MKSNTRVFVREYLTGMQRDIGISSEVFNACVKELGEGLAFLEKAALVLRKHMDKEVEKLRKEALSKSKI